jgi:tRNA modification GTPase
MPTSDTIAAVATPPGTGGLAVIRVSGPRALAIADLCFHPGRPSSPLPSNAPSHTVHHGFILSNGQRIDEVLLTVLRAPRTYTREDTIEVGCHGGPLVTRQVLDTFLHAGASLAAPGEFTRRAFLNGRLDLSQAEAVVDLIHARTQLALHAAHAQLAGHLSQLIHTLRDDLLLVLAHVEAHIDFPDEDIDPETGSALLRRLDSTRDLAQRLIRSAPEGRILREGARTVLLGRPNAGKSSLLNQLLGLDRAIVSPIPGTTRDTIEESANIRGLPIVFIDTAGLRDASDLIESEGIRRTHEAALSADLVLCLLDLSTPPDPADADLFSTVPPHKTLWIGNKSDLPTHPGHDQHPDLIRISCRTGDGLETLRDRVRDRLCAGGLGSDEAALAINARHLDALNRTLISISHTREALASGMPLDLVAVDLRAAVQAVGEIVGKTTTDDLLDRIFSTFCLGK